MGGGGGRGDLLAGIRNSGKGGLRRVPSSEKRIRETAIASGSSGAGGAAAAKNPMEALQEALNKRKKKVTNVSG